MQAAFDAYQTEVLKDSPLALFPLTDALALGNASGKDYSGNGRDLTNMNSLKGLAGGPGSFAPSACIGNPSASAHFEVAHATWQNVNDVCTLEAWHRGASGADSTIISGGQYSCLLRMNSDGTYGLVKSYIANIVNSTIAYSIPVWRHIVGTKNGSTVKIYVDGVDLTGSVANATCATSSRPLCVGCDTNQLGAYANYLVGNLAWVAIYNTALSQNRVRAHYAAGYRNRVAIAAGRNRMRSW